MPGTSLDVANEFIRLAKESGRELTQMQLQKLVYIAHGWKLALSDAELTTDKPQAWDFGPVYPNLYEQLKKYGRGPVSDYVRSLEQSISYWFGGKKDGLPSTQLDEADKQLISSVFQIYGSYPAFQLSALTHEDDTPWSQVYERNGNRHIPDAIIETHFKKLAKDRAEQR